jgi:hypothetical protein
VCNQSSCSHLGLKEGNCPLARGDITPKMIADTTRLQQSPNGSQILHCGLLEPCLVSKLSHPSLGEESGTDRYRYRGNEGDLDGENGRYCFNVLEGYMRDCLCSDAGKIGLIKVCSTSEEAHTAVRKCACLRPRIIQIMRCKWIWESLSAANPYLHTSKKHIGRI